MSTTEKSRCSIGFCGLLAVVFIALKLGGVISWSWWWVLAPLWIPWALVLFALTILALAAIAIAGSEA
jgi:hypothetical protein